MTHHLNTLFHSKQLQSKVQSTSRPSCLFFFSLSFSPSVVGGVNSPSAKKKREIIRVQNIINCASPCLVVSRLFILSSLCFPQCSLLPKNSNKFIDIRAFCCVFCSFLSLSPTFSFACAQICTFDFNPACITPRIVIGLFVCVCVFSFLFYWTRPPPSFFFQTKESTNTHQSCWFYNLFFFSLFPFFRIAS